MDEIVPCYNGNDTIKSPPPSPTTAQRLYKYRGHTISHPLPSMQVSLSNGMIPGEH